MTGGGAVCQVGVQYDGWERSMTGGAQSDGSGRSMTGGGAV